jgi:hypothetical protein
VTGLRAHRLLALAALILTLVMAGSHPLELWGKLRFDGATWLAVQQNLYVAFGVVAAVSEPGAVMALWLLVWREWRAGLAWRASALAAALTTIALLIWALTVAPVNAVLSGWTIDTLPPDWQDLRDQWEAGHAVHAALLAAALAVLLAALAVLLAALVPDGPVSRRERR